MDELIRYIHQLQTESFEGWTEDAKAGYLTALISVGEKAIQLYNPLEHSLPSGWIPNLMASYRGYCRVDNVLHIVKLCAGQFSIIHEDELGYSQLILNKSEVKKLYNLDLSDWK